MHNQHHMGVDRTLYLAKSVDPDVSRGAVRRIVQTCQRCQSIDPAPVVHERGRVFVDKQWGRLAIDVTHYRNVPYLSMVDCGPSRYAIWRELPNETAEVVVKVLDTVFFEHGPVDELLMDNSTVFRSQKLRDLLDKWGVRRCFRAAYRPSGNGIVERHHRTIKAMAERGGISPIEAVFWYNVTPRQGQSVESVPQLGVFKYLWRHPLQDGGESQSTKENPSRVVMGEEVWVKPADGRCTTQWKKGRVTGINSNNNVSVDGMPRHILDLRKVVYEP